MSSQSSFVPEGRDQTFIGRRSRSPRRVHSLGASAPRTLSKSSANLPITIAGIVYEYRMDRHSYTWLSCVCPIRRALVPAWVLRPDGPRHRRALPQRQLDKFQGFAFSRIERIDRHEAAQAIGGFSQSGRELSSST